MPEATSSSASTSDPSGSKSESGSAGASGGGAAAAVAAAAAGAAAAGESATVVVTLSDDSVGDADVERIRGELEDSGLAVEQVLGFLGQIVGTASLSDVEPLRKVKGVAAVEVSQTVQLPPPDSAVQ